jgi:transglutaminase-like putative cysteine protease
VFLLGSRYCETDLLSEVAWDLFSTSSTGWGRVQAICDFVHQHIVFGYELARATKTAWEAFNEGPASAVITRTSPSHSAAA